MMIHGITTGGPTKGGSPPPWSLWRNLVTPHCKEMLVVSNLNRGVFGTVSVRDVSWIHLAQKVWRTPVKTVVDPQVKTHHRIYIPS